MTTSCHIYLSDFSHHGLEVGYAFFTIRYVKSEGHEMALSVVMPGEIGSFLSVCFVFDRFLKSPLLGQSWLLSSCELDATSCCVQKLLVSQ